MGQSIKVVTALGWVVDEFEGTYPANLEQFIGDVDDLYDFVEKTLREDGNACKALHFGYDRGSLAVVHAASVKKCYNWFNSFADVDPDREKEPQFRRECLQALDALGWDEAGLGDPQWLVLVSYD